MASEPFVVSALLVRELRGLFLPLLRLTLRSIL